MVRRGREKQNTSHAATPRMPYSKPSDCPNKKPGELHRKFIWKPDNFGPHKWRAKCGDCGARWDFELPPIAESPLITLAEEALNRLLNVEQ